MGTMRTLVRGGMVVTEAGTVSGNILIKDGRILGITEAQDADAVIDKLKKWDK